METRNIGTIVQVIGPVLDIRFEAMARMQRFVERVRDRA